MPGVTQSTRYSSSSSVGIKLLGSGAVIARIMLEPGYQRPRRRFSGSRLAVLSGVLILVHGLGSFATGYFSCDQGCAPAEPSTSQQIHNLAGLIMFCSLTVASAIWIFLGKRLMPSSQFGTISIACLGFAVVTVSMMAKAFADGHLFGLYQRLNYGVSVVWIAALSAMALRQVQSLGGRQCASS